MQMAARMKHEVHLIVWAGCVGVIQQVCSVEHAANMSRFCRDLDRLGKVKSEPLRQEEKNQTLVDR